MINSKKSLFIFASLIGIINGCGSPADPSMTDVLSNPDSVMVTPDSGICNVRTIPYVEVQALPAGTQYQVETIRDEVVGSYQSFSVSFHTNVPVRTVNLGASYEAFLFLDGIRQRSRLYNERVQIGNRGVTSLPDPVPSLDCNGNKIYAYAMHIGIADTHGMNSQVIDQLLQDSQRLQIRIDICNDVTCVGGTTTEGTIHLE